MLRALPLLVLGACQFAPGQPQPQQGVDGNTQGLDAKVFEDARALDAKVFDDAPPVAGSLVVTMTPATGDVNLTTEGTADWMHWGFPDGTTGVDHKQGAGLLVDKTTAGIGAVTNVTFTATWSDGNPDANVSQTGTGFFVTQPDAFVLQAPATRTPHTLHLYAGGKHTTSTLTVSLSDSSATAFTDTQVAGNTALHLDYTIVYNAAADAQTLNVSWQDTTDDTGGFTMLLSASLQ